MQHKPAGIAVLITPWNYPAATGTRKIAPTLAAGCPVIIKPASEIPLTMLALMPLLEVAGVPKGVVSFTGTTEVGRTLLRTAADQVLKPAMKLGGNAPLIVFGDADLDVTVDGTVLAKMRNIDEACTATPRWTLAHWSVPRPVTRWRSSCGMRSTRGAVFRLGGVVPNGIGFFYPPTVLANVPQNADCVQDEIFGPVAAIRTFPDTDDVIRRVNATEYGLVAYVFAGDMRRGLNVCERLDYGMGGLNCGLVSDPAAPFGGTKQSGLGREVGHEGTLEFMETHYISASW